MVSVRSSAKISLLVAIAILALFGALLHQHQSASDAAGCPCCHTGLQAAVADLASSLVVPSLAAQGLPSLSSSSRVVPAALLASLAPRAPPASTLPAQFREGGAVTA